jgi:hypothetical protein
VIACCTSWLESRLPTALAEPVLRWPLVAVVGCSPEPVVSTLELLPVSATETWIEVISTE